MSSQQHQVSSNELAQIGISTAVESSISVTQEDPRQTDTALAAQVRGSEAETTLQLEGGMNPLEALSSRQANHKAEHSADLSSRSKVSHPEADRDSHRRSLDGILAMIESAVYPHCVAASSPTGSITSQCTVLPLPENVRELKDPQTKSIARSEEEMTIGVVADTEQVDAFKDQSQAGLVGQKDPATKVELGRATSSTEGRHDEVTKAPSTHVVDNNDPFPAPSDRSYATVKDQSYHHGSTTDSIHLDTKEESGFDDSSQREAIVTSSFIDHIPIVKPSDLSESRPEQDQAPNEIHQPELTHGKVTPREHPSTSQMSAAPSLSDQNSFESMPPLLPETISLSISQPAEVTAAAGSAPARCETKQEPVKAPVLSRPKITEEQIASSAGTCLLRFEPRCVILKIQKHRTMCILIRSGGENISCFGVHGQRRHRKEPNGGGAFFVTKADAGLSGATRSRLCGPICDSDSGRC